MCDDRGVTSVDDYPQVGPLDVAPESLERTGVGLAALLAELGVTLEGGSASDAPLDGWRVLRYEKTGAVSIGAPIDHSATSWRIARISVDREGTLRPAIVHPDVFPRRPSRSQRAKGLTLRWPPLSQSEAESDIYVIDIVNTGVSRWRPDGDPFHVVGVFRLPGEEHGGFSFGFFGSQSPAVPLDPGDYARVRISVDEGQWTNLDPGRYELHAVLATLAVSPAEPLGIDLTRERIDEHRAKASARTPTEMRESLEQQHRHIETLIEGSDKIDAVARAVMAADADNIARTKVQHVLQVGEEAASDIMNSPLRQFSKESVQQLKAQAQQIRDRLNAFPTT